MSKQQDSPISITSGEVLAAFRRVKVVGATVIYADRGNYGHGTTEHAAVTSGDEVQVRLDGHGTHMATLSGSCSAGDALYSDDDGKLSTTAFGNQVAWALEDGSGNNSIIEVLPLLNAPAASSSSPSGSPSVSPSNSPSSTPSVSPSSTPSVSPSNSPSSTPSVSPSGSPSVSPSSSPS